MFRIVSIFVISTTFTKKLIKKIVNNLKLNENVKIIQKFIDRENIFYNVQIIKFFEFKNFRFLIFNISAFISKIIIYKNFIVAFKKMMKILIDFYVTNEITSNQTRIVIKCYNEKMFEFEKFKICEKFFKSNSNIRILCFTDVMKLSMNIIDIDIVIQ